MNHTPKKVYKKGGREGTKMKNDAKRKENQQITAETKVNTIKNYFENILGLK